MRAQLLWPLTVREWLWGLFASVPVAALLLGTRSLDSQSAALAASLAVALSIPWVVPATMLIAVLSAPVYMWLHSQGPVPAVLDWLGSVVLVAAVVGCHLNTALLVAWHRTRKASEAEIGLRDFLFHHGQHK
ncbi:MAG: hypothetical protein M3496_00155 [Pseudomonadota bacterium]|nr:hypothetical protein [Burkholderiaceae bacterium]MDQ3444577.1 hypothetical protein [Pseudomonadota bacterium]